MRSTPEIIEDTVYIVAAYDRKQTPEAGNFSRNRFYWYKETAIKEAENLNLLHEKDIFRVFKVKLVIEPEPIPL